MAQDRIDSFFSHGNEHHTCEHCRHWLGDYFNKTHARRAGSHIWVGQCGNEDSSLSPVAETATGEAFVFTPADGRCDAFAMHENVAADLAADAGTVPPPGSGPLPRGLDGGVAMQDRHDANNVSPESAVQQAEEPRREADACPPEMMVDYLTGKGRRISLDCLRHTLECIADAIDAAELTAHEAGNTELSAALDSVFCDVSRLIPAYPPVKKSRGLIFSTATLAGLLQAHARAEDTLWGFTAKPDKIRASLENPATKDDAIFQLQQGSRALSILSCLEAGDHAQARTYISGLAREAFKQAERLGMAKPGKELERIDPALEAEKPEALYRSGPADTPSTLSCRRSNCEGCAHTCQAPGVTRNHPRCACQRRSGGCHE